MTLTHVLKELYWTRRPWPCFASVLPHAVRYLVCASFLIAHTCACMHVWTHAGMCACSPVQPQHYKCMVILAAFAQLKVLCYVLSVNEKIRTWWKHLSCQISVIAESVKFWIVHDGDLARHSRWSSTILEEDLSQQTVACDKS